MSTQYINNIYINNKTLITNKEIVKVMSKLKIFLCFVHFQSTNKNQNLQNPHFVSTPESAVKIHFSVCRGNHKN